MDQCKEAHFASSGAPVEDITTFMALLPLRHTVVCVLGGSHPFVPLLEVEEVHHQAAS